MTTKIRWPRDKPIIECDEIPRCVVTVGFAMALIMVFTWGYFHYLHRDIVQVFVAVQDPTVPSYKDEFEKHWGDIPTETFEVSGGRVINHYGNTDRCLGVERVNADGPNQVLAFVLDETAQQEGIASLFSTPAYAGGPSKINCAVVGCRDPAGCAADGSHPGAFEYEVMAINEDSAWVVYTFSDCCRYRQHLNHLTGEKGPVIWECCTHGESKK